MAGAVMVAMSGGVDSCVAAALLRDGGYHVVGVTMKLWGGPSDTGCCAVSDVNDARRAADRLGIEHHVFNFGDEFDRDVVAPYVADHAAGRTPNPCIECNRHLKFDRLLRRADALGFDLVATGHHARVVDTPAGPRLSRGADTAKDQSYVLHMLNETVLGRILFPVGELTKDEVRATAAGLGLATAAKPDSQDVCFITDAHGRKAFLGDRIALRPATVIDQGVVVGEVPAVELVTIGQRRGLGLTGGAAPRYVVDVDTTTCTVTVGNPSDLLVDQTPLESWTWVGDPVDQVRVQCSAHGSCERAKVVGNRVCWAAPQRRVAPGQSIVAYADLNGDNTHSIVVGGGIAGR